MQGGPSPRSEAECCGHHPRGLVRIEPSHPERPALVAEDALVKLDQQPVGSVVWHGGILEPSIDDRPEPQDVAAGSPAAPPQVSPDGGRHRLDPHEDDSDLGPVRVEPARSVAIAVESWVRPMM